MMTPARPRKCHHTEHRVSGGVHFCLCEYVYVVYVVVYRRVSAPDPGCHCVH